MKHWFKNKYYAIRWGYYRPRHIKQRALRGYSDFDTWGFDYYLAGVISKGVRHLADNLHSHPMGTTPEEWENTLNQIADGFELEMKLSDLDYDWQDKKLEKKLHKQRDQAFDLFRDNFGGLWS